jgi:hypothetical protein
MQPPPQDLCQNRNRRGGRGKGLVERTNQKRNNLSHLMPCILNFCNAKNLRPSSPSGADWFLNSWRAKRGDTRSAFIWWKALLAISLYDRKNPEMTTIQENISESTQNLHLPSTCSKQNAVSQWRVDLTSLVRCAYCYAALLIVSRNETID